MTDRERRAEARLSAVVDDAGRLIDAELDAAAERLRDDAAAALLEKPSDHRRHDAAAFAADCLVELRRRRSSVDVRALAEAKPAGVARVETTERVVEQTRAHLRGES